MENTQRKRKPGGGAKKKKPTLVFSIRDDEERIERIRKKYKPKVLQLFGREFLKSIDI